VHAGCRRGRRQADRRGAPVAARAWNSPELWPAPKASETGGSAAASAPSLAVGSIRATRPSSIPAVTAAGPPATSSSSWTRSAQEPATPPGRRSSGSVRPKAAATSASAIGAVSPGGKRSSIRAAAASGAMLPRRGLDLLQPRSGGRFGQQLGTRPPGPPLPLRRPGPVRVDDLGSLREIGGPRTCPALAGNARPILAPAAEAVAAAGGLSYTAARRSHEPALVPGTRPCRLIQLEPLDVPSVNGRSRDRAAGGRRAARDDRLCAARDLDADRQAWWACVRGGVLEVDPRRHGDRRACNPPPTSTPPGGSARPSPIRPSRSSTAPASQ
jgi:hypothetical protein